LVIAEVGHSQDEQEKKCLLEKSVAEMIIGELLKISQTLLLE